MGTVERKSYIPTNLNTHTIKNGAVSCKTGRFYVSVLVERQERENPILNKYGMGIDLGLKDFAICSNGKTYKNINRSSQIRKLGKRLRREQRSLSRKYESYKKLKKFERRSYSTKYSKAKAKGTETASET